MSTKNQFTLSTKKHSKNKYPDYVVPSPSTDWSEEDATTEGSRLSKAHKEKTAAPINIKKETAKLRGNNK